MALRLPTLRLPTLHLPTIPAGRPQGYAPTI